LSDIVVKNIMFAQSRLFWRSADVGVSGVRGDETDALAPVIQSIAHVHAGERLWWRIWGVRLKVVYP
jgi:hypothetical protein